MDTTASSTQTGGMSPSQAAEQLKKALSTADGNVLQGIQNLQSVHQARLSQANRTLTALKAKYGPDDPRVKTAEASVAAKTNTIARISTVRQQLAAPSVQVAKTGWALQGRVLDAQLQPAVRFTVFLVDTKKTYLQQYGFAYTDETGYFLLNYPGDAASPSETQLFIEIANTDANPVYLSSTPFQPVIGSASFENIVLPAGGQSIGDPPEAIRATAMPGKGGKKKRTAPVKNPKPE
jgi:hypothetical protein